MDYIIDISAYNNIDFAIYDENMNWLYPEQLIELLPDKMSKLYKLQCGDYYIQIYFTDRCVEGDILINLKSNLQKNPVFLDVNNDLLTNNHNTLENQQESYYMFACQESGFYKFTVNGITGQL